MFISLTISARQLYPSGLSQKEKPLQAFQAERIECRAWEVLMALLERLLESGDAINTQQFRVLGGCCCYPGQKNAGNPHY